MQNPIWQVDDPPQPVEGLDAHGRPQPEYAAALGLRPAPFGRRALASAIDAAIAGALLAPMLMISVPALRSAGTTADDGAALADRSDLTLVAVSAAVSCALATAYLITQLVLHGRSGLTAGKALAGIRSVNVSTLERPGFWRGAVVRFLMLCGSAVVPVAGPIVVFGLSPLRDPEKRGRGWADAAARTWLVDIRGGLNPYDTKRMRIARKALASTLRDDSPTMPSLASSPSAASARQGAAPVAPPRSRGGVLGPR